MSIGIFTICCIIYRLEKFVIEVYYPFFHGSLFHTMVVVPERMLGVRIPSEKVVSRLRV